MAVVESEVVFTTDIIEGEHIETTAVQDYVVTSHVEEELHQDQEQIEEHIGLDQSQEIGVTIEHEEVEYEEEILHEDSITTNLKVEQKEEDEEEEEEEEFEEEKPDILMIWERYQEFELCLYDQDEHKNVTDFISEWERKMCSALAFGCLYSDLVLVFKLLEKACLEYNQIVSVLQAVMNGDSQKSLLGKTIDKLKELSGESPSISLPVGGKRSRGRPKGTKNSGPKKSRLKKPKTEVKEDDDQVNGDHDNSGLNDDYNDNGDYEDGDGQLTSDTKTSRYTASVIRTAMQNDLLTSAPTATDFEGLTTATELQENQCPICLKTFKRKYDVKPHLLTHKTQKEFTCDTCGTMFMRKKDLNVHKKRNRCMYRINSARKVVPASAKPFACQLCNKTYETRSQLRVHNRKHTGEKPFKCEACGDAFTTYSELYRHRRQHPGFTSFFCNECDRDFMNSETFKNHREKYHGENKSEIDIAGEFQCPHCPIQFQSSMAYDTHLRLHGRVSNFSCDICGKSCPSKSGLKIHRLIHSKEKPFKCFLCNKTFCQSSGLKTHFRTHSGERPYKCDECGRCFAIKKTLVIHTRTHTKERPYSCNVCGKSFGHQHVLKIHQRNHLEKKPFSCQLCSQAFVKPAALKKHMKTHKEKENYGAVNVN